MKDFDNDNFKKLKEKLSKEKGTISKCDFAESINKIVTSAIGSMFFFNNMDLAFEIAALKTNEAMDELFSKEPDEEPDAEKPAEKTAPSSLEKLLFDSAQQNLRWFITQQDLREHIAVLKLCTVWSWMRGLRKNTTSGRR